MAAKNAVGNALTGSTGSGNFVGATSPSIATPTITGLSSATVATDDKVLILDTSASDVTKYVTSQSIADLYKSSQAFWAYGTGAQTLTTGTATKITLDGEVFDNGSRFDSTTNYRYTPTKAGTYIFTAMVTFSSSTDQMYLIAQLKKNGTTFVEVNYKTSGTGTLCCSVLGVCKLNGSTDYVEFFGYQGSGSNKDTFPGSAYTFLAGGLLEQD